VHLILRALNGVVLNRIEGRTTMLDWTLDEIVSFAQENFHTLSLLATYTLDFANVIVGSKLQQNY
jgi:hypothetical protein